MDTIEIEIDSAKIYEKMKLSDDLQDVLIFRGMQLQLQLAFDTVLRAQELQEDCFLPSR
jgi:hypothetical protein